MGKNKEVKKNNRVLVKVLRIIILIFIIVILLSLYYSIGGIDAIKFMLVVFLIIIISYILVTNIHELGHFLFGRLYGYKLISYRFGFLAWNNENGKVKLTIIKNKGYSGFCVMIPPENELAKYKIVLFYAAGTLFNIISGAVVLMITSYVKDEPINTLFTSFGIISIGFGAINLLPFITGNNPSDGKVVWSLLLNKPFADRILFLKRLIAKLSAGIRPRQLEIPRLDITQLNSIELQIIGYAYFKALDAKNHNEIVFYANLLEENIEKASTLALPGIYNELCYVGCITSDLTKANNYYIKGGRTLKQDQDINGCRIKAYYECYVNEDADAAMEFCKKGLAVKDKFAIKGQALMEEDLIKSLIHFITTK